MSVKETLKRGRTSLKPLLTESMRALLPRTFLQGPKRGFTVPVEIWLKGLLKRSFEEIVLDKSNAEYLDLENIRVMWDAHQRGRVHWAVPWSVYAFSRWRMEQSANAQ
jgi:asparagine synthase (glutamine-hydrolysing)